MNRIALLLAMALIIFGGSASLSKNFIVLGAACAVGYAFMNKLLSRWLMVILSIPIIAVAPIGLERVNINYIASIRDLYLDQGLIGALSAGRFGTEGGSVALLFESLMETGDGWTGRGLGSQLPLDSGYLEYFYQGGILSLAGYLMALATLSLYGWKNRAHRDGQLLLVLMAYIWLSSAGGPTITASRTGIILLILISACLVGIRNTPRYQLK
jgi:O-antigen ligase